jgi:hypothetical protein
VYLCVTLYANGKGWPDVIDQWQQYGRAVCKAHLNLMSQLAHRLHAERYNSQSRFRLVPLSFESDPDVPSWTKECKHCQCLSPEL